MATGKYGLVNGNVGSDFGQVAVMQKENPGMEWVPIPWPSLESGEEFTVNAGSYRVEDNYILWIPRTCKNPEAAARVIDYWVSEEGTALTRYGVEGLSYDWVDGKIVFKEVVTNDPNGLGLADALEMYTGPNLINPGVMTRESRMNSYTMQEQLDALEVWDYPDNTTRVLPAISMTTEELEEFNMLITDIKTYAKEYRMKFILGSESLDKFDEFREGLVDLGIERAIELKQAAYDRFLAR